MSEYNELDMMIDFYNPKSFVDGCKCDLDVNYTCELCMTYNVLREAKRMLMVRDAEIERLQKDRSRSENELDRLREWVAEVEDGYDKQKVEVERLKVELVAARESLRLADADAAKLRGHGSVAATIAEIERQAKIPKMPNEREDEPIE